MVAMGVSEAVVASKTDVAVVWDLVVVLVDVGDVVASISNGVVALVCDSSKNGDEAAGFTEVRRVPIEGMAGVIVSSGSGCMVLKEASLVGFASPVVVREADAASDCVVVCSACADDVVLA